MNDLYPEHKEPQSPRGERPGVHPHVLSDLKAWLDGELPTPQVLLVRAHLWFCPACREEVKWLKRLGEDMRDLERAVPSPRLRARIMAALPDTPPGRPAKQSVSTLRWPQYTLAAGVACVALASIFIASYFVHPREHSTPPVIAGVPPLVSQPLPAVGTDAVPAVLPNTGEDRYTDAADQMYAQWLRDQEQRSSQDLQKNRRNWKALVASLRPAPTSDPKPRNGDALHLALSVPDVDAAEKRIIAWAEAVGGENVGSPSPPPSEGVAPLITGAESPRDPASAAQPSEVVALTLRVPAARVGSLEAVLKQVGAIPSVSGATRKTSVPDRTLTGAHPGGKLASAEPATRTNSPAGVEDSSTSIRQVKPPTTDGQTLARDGGLKFVTLHIALTGAEPSLP